MRITSFTIYNQLTKSLQEKLQDLSIVNDKLSSGKKINNPSDDPFGMIKALDYKLSINEIEQYSRNIDEADSHLNLSDTVLSSTANALTRARELAIEASNDTQTAQNRASIAEEVATLRDEIFSLSQTKLRDRYIFSGYKTDTAPFDSSFTYVGDSGEINVLTNRGATIAINITGDEAFSYGGVSFFESLDDLYNALINNDRTSIQSSITSIDNDIDQVANVRAELGARMNYLDRLKITNEERSVNLKMILSNTEDSDMTETISELAKIQFALESLRASGSRILSQSLLDFLR